VKGENVLTNLRPSIKQLPLKTLPEVKTFTGLSSRVADNSHFWVKQGLDHKIIGL